VGPQVPALERIQHLDQSDPAGARRRHAVHVVAAVGAADHRPALRGVGGEIGTGDEPAVRQHFLLEQARRLAGVETRGALRRDPLERARQVRLPEHVARRVGRAVLRELRQRSGVATEVRDLTREGAREGVGNLEPFAGQPDCGRHQCRPRLRTVLTPGEMQARDGARHAHGPVPLVVRLAIVAAVTQPHLRVRAGGCRLAKIIGHRFAPGRAIHEKPAATDIAGRRMRHGQGERRGDSGVDRVAAGADHLEACRRGEIALRDHQADGGADGSGTGERGRQRRHEQAHRQDQDAGDKAEGARHRGRTAERTIQPAAASVAAGRGRGQPEFAGGAARSPPAYPVSHDAGQRMRGVGQTAHSQRAPAALWWRRYGRGPIGPLRSSLPPPP